ncbi:diaminopimelate epimerase [Roseomonas sp. NAR14]|uniref:Diaminopimelate epimerase n=1 Tax=Roseomonas acroporae TaxID=2937791 RepID=A0A9X1Y616_9PROT|nr:diaminopimelate epimerase [Roseomonas acroporae]MCK8783772.1 diaminopimelate epimerase [Roseomonas acroporae]
MTPFVKMHGLGNDFVIMDGRRSPLGITPARAAAIADRRHGVGCDQLIVLEPAADGTPGEPGAFMRILNPDGSEAGACGNATRCVAHLLFGEAGADRATIRTVSGLLPATRGADGRITVDMGPPRLDWQSVPLAFPADTLHLPLSRGPVADPAACSMGNPHATFFVPALDALPLAAIGPSLEHDPIFPERANIGFVQAIAPDHLRLAVWERGAGLTLACGSGACAALVNAHRRGLAARRATVALPGGELVIEWRETDGHVLMTGPVATAFTGALDLDGYPA